MAVDASTPSRRDMLGVLAATPPLFGTGGTFWSAPSTAFGEAAAAYLAARAAEQLYDRTVLMPMYRAAVAGAPNNDAIEEESNRLADARDAAEDALMAIPSPDGAAFAMKYLIAHGGLREMTAFDAQLEADATRLAARWMEARQ